MAKFDELFVSSKGLIESMNRASRLLNSDASVVGLAKQLAWMHDPLHGLGIPKMEGMFAGEKFLAGHLELSKLAKQLKWLNEPLRGAGLPEIMQWQNGLISSIGKLGAQDWPGGVRLGFENALLAQAAKIGAAFESPLDAKIYSQLSSLQKMFASPIEDVAGLSGMENLVGKAGFAVGGALSSYVAEVGKSVADSLALGSLASTFAAVGLIGKFDPILVERFIEAASWVESIDEEGDGGVELAEARENSVVVDAVAEVASLTTLEPGGVSENQWRLFVEVVFRVCVRIFGTPHAAVMRATPHVNPYLMMFSFVLSVLAFQAQRKSGVESGQDAKALLNAVLEGNRVTAEESARLYEVIDRLQKTLDRRDGQGLVLRVERKTFLMSHRSTESEKLLELRSGQLVERTARHYKWVEVRVFDYASEKEVVGWVLRKELGEVETEVQD
ncbi:hypothetical protein [Myxococcus qinghaiensis]|uniref:hypothetical protein n=1 Tax=Myxococcus qinghaiensis TaxID=2906758 RepID=UPI0020A72218|nr:hypothetical protein [Myxococcus qinghaiensis]MCP3163316.1 hypothetical protein [Myxococcus qinghaiensis]